MTYLTRAQHSTLAECPSLSPGTKARPPEQMVRYGSVNEETLLGPLVVVYLRVHLHAEGCGFWTASDPLGSLILNTKASAVHTNDEVVG